MKKILAALVMAVLSAPAMAEQQTSLEILKQAAPEPGVVSAVRAPEISNVSDVSNSKDLPWQRRVTFMPEHKSAGGQKGTCTVTDLGGEMDISGCHGQDGKYRCYANVELNGNPFHITGACTESFSDCWATGSSVVKDPCNSISENTPSSQPSDETGCSIINQSGNIDPWECRNSPNGSTRCYADARINGREVRVFGACAASFSDCWYGKSAAVNPCR